MHATPRVSQAGPATAESRRAPALPENLPAVLTQDAPYSPPGFGTVRYWLWRLAGRPANDADELFEFRQRDHDRALARERRRVAELAKLTETLQHLHEREAERLKKAAAAAEEQAAALARSLAESERMTADLVSAHDRLVAKLTASHEEEMARLHDGHHQALARLRSDAARERDSRINPLQWDLEQARQRIAELEAEAIRRDEAHRRELARAQTRPSPAPEQAELDSTRARADAAEERARLAENKVEVLKDAVELARARSGAAPTIDSRFRDAKRAFARAFHPDQGGRDDPERQRMFLAFWPELERIEREG